MTWWPMLYTRHQLVLLLGLLAAAGVGLAVREWRAAYPEIVERLEQFDRDVAPPREAKPARLDAPRTPPASPPPEGPRTIRAAPKPGKMGRSATSHQSEPIDPIDLNRASADDLSRLPGVGIALATRIVEAREATGGFTSLDDLRRVRGVGSSKLERLRRFVTIAE